MKTAEAVAMDTALIGPSENLAPAKQIVKRNMLWAMGIGLIPVPLVDVVGITGFQAKMLKEMSDLYKVPFYEHKVKNIVASLISGLSTPYLATAFFGTVVKLIPGLGTVAGVTAVPLMAGAITYAVGHVFIQHFEAGGTVLNFDPNAMREHFNNMVKEGMEVAKETQASEGAAASSSSTTAKSSSSSSSK